MRDCIGQFPFLLPLFAAALLEMSATLLRRAAVVLGRLWSYLSAALSAAAMASLLVSGAWAVAFPTEEAAYPWVRVSWAGWLLIVLGLMLLAWSARTLGVRALLGLPDARLAVHGPYRLLRRPMWWGFALSAAGAAFISSGRQPWIWFVAWLAISLPLAEVEEWELRSRLPDAEVYLRHIPRLLPRRRVRRQR